MWKPLANLKISTHVTQAEIPPLAATHSFLNRHISELYLHCSIYNITITGKPERVQFISWRYEGTGGKLSIEKTS